VGIGEIEDQPAEAAGLVLQSAALIDVGPVGCVTAMGPPSLLDQERVGGCCGDTGSGFGWLAVQGTLYIGEAAKMGAGVGGIAVQVRVSKRSM
jgi:hypothetical protein